VIMVGCGCDSSASFGALLIAAALLRRRGRKRPMPRTLLLALLERHHQPDGIKT
jgi:hypothetical protein